jgi:hypothetical protein
LRVALYSRTARGAVVDARAWIKAAECPPTPEGIRRFRVAMMARPVDDPVRAWLTRSYDFYSLSQCRDLVFHVQEHTFTLPEIAEMTRTFGLSILRVEVKSPVHLGAYQNRFPEDTAATNLANWHELEQDHPSMFAGMYSLWLCRTTDEGRASPSWLDDADEP